MIRATHPHEKIQAFTAQLRRSPVPKEGATKLAYRVRVRF